MTVTATRPEILVIADQNAPSITTVSDGGARLSELESAAREVWTLGPIRLVETTETAPDEFVTVFVPA